MMFGKDRKKGDEAPKTPEETSKANEANEAGKAKAGETAPKAEPGAREIDPKDGEIPNAEGNARPEGEEAKPSEPDWKNLYAVTLADFDNYKKRAARDREDVYRYAESDILKDILPTVDNLALAIEHARDAESEFVKGVKLVHGGLLKALSDHGAKPMEDLVGKQLDPNFHEAIATLPNAGIDEGRITNVVKTGWMLNDRLLRAAQVVVSAGKPEQPVKEDEKK